MLHCWVSWVVMFATDLTLHSTAVLGCFQRSVLHLLVIWFPIFAFPPKADHGTPPVNGSLVYPYAIGWSEDMSTECAYPALAFLGHLTVWIFTLPLFILSCTIFVSCANYFGLSDSLPFHKFSVHANVVWVVLFAPYPSGWLAVWPLIWYPITWEFFFKMVLTVHLFISSTSTSWICALLLDLVDVCLLSTLCFF